MNNKHYLTTQPVQNKSISKDCERIFCKDYKDKLRFANAVNTGGKKIFHIVKIGGKQSVIILN